MWNIKNKNVELLAINESLKKQKGMKGNKRASAEMKNKLVEAQLESRTLQEKCKLLNKRNQDLQQQLNEVKTIEQSHQQEKKHLKRVSVENVHIIEKLDKLQDQLSETIKYNDMNERLVTTEIKRGFLEKELEKTNDLVKSLKDENEKLNKNIETQQEMLENSEQAVNKVKEQSNSEKRTLEDKILRMEEKLDVYRNNQGHRNR
eukprot:UN34419